MNPLINTKSEIVISCLPELGSYVAKELEKYSFPVKKVLSTSVVTEGTLKDTYFLNLWLRTASHVFYKLKSFKSNTADQLYGEIKKVEWENWIPTDSYFTVDSFVRNDNIRDHRFANVRVKDAIVDRFMDLEGKRPDSGSSRDGAVVYLQWVSHEASIYIDTSGNTLSKRGYRDIPGGAPLAESLAAAIIMATGWSGDTPFVNPMCGSGTLGIEAALIAYNIPPGYYRRVFGFQYLKTFEISDWKEELAKMPDPKKIEKKIPILMSDIKRKAISETRINVEKAGVEHLLELEARDFEKAQLPDEPGTIILNPPYGNRMGEEDDLEQLYERIGDFFKNKCVNYKGYIFTGNMDLAKTVGLRTKSRVTFFNAKLECRLLEYEIFEGSKKTKT
ncbi:MAG: class I SAM-dependent RNA methyltransferase [Cyclobacteriaceae bacterium]|nr:class I SAM-dependent RNA methyltransferase [Cyclobacteriaceae bacterium]